MKKGIHPEYKNILIIMTDGSSYKSRSTSRRKRSLWKLDMDTRSHLFWTSGSGLSIVDTGGQRAKFKKRFSLEDSNT